MPVPYQAHHKPELETEIDLILWQDLRTVEAPGRSCWSERIRLGVKALPPDEQLLWRNLFQTFYSGIAIFPPKRWPPRAERALSALGPMRFAERIRAWIGPVATKPLVLTTAGSYVWKNLIWLAAVVREPELNEVLHASLFQPWKRRQPVEKVAIAIAYLWRRPDAPHSADILSRRLKEAIDLYGRL